MPWPATLGTRRVYLHVPFFRKSNPKWWFVPLKMMWTSWMWHRVKLLYKEICRNFIHGKEQTFVLFECTIVSVFPLLKWWLNIGTGAIVVAMIFSQWNDPAPSSWWVSFTFGWCWALNELWIAHAVAFVCISITRCHPCRSKPRLVLFLFLLLLPVYFECSFSCGTGFSEFNLGIWYKYLKKKGVPFTTKSAHVVHVVPVQASSRPGDYRPGFKRKE